MFQFKNKQLKIKSIQIIFKSTLSKLLNFLFEIFIEVKNYKVKELNFDNV